MSNHLIRSGYRNLNIITRRFSSFNSNRNRTGVASILANEDVSIWSENNWSQYAKQISKPLDFPLPGQVGIAFQKSSSPVPQIDFISKEKSPRRSRRMRESENQKKQEAVSELLHKPLPEQDQSITIKQAIDYQLLFEQEYSQEVISDIKNSLELKGYPLPRSLQKDFQAYFPKLDLSSVNVITISFKTENDMATWSSDVESEREAVIKKFVDLAQGLCTKFKTLGFWADYIDPSCGRPFNAPYGHATFFETDERYRNFGFEIVDQGCCKVISHHLWGSKCYVGCFLTNAPLEAKITKKVLNTFNKQQ